MNEKISTQDIEKILKIQQQRKIANAKYYYSKAKPERQRLSAIAQKLKQISNANKG